MLNLITRPGKIGVVQKQAFLQVSLKKHNSKIKSKTFVASTTSSFDIELMYTVVQCRIDYPKPWLSKDSIIQSVFVYEGF